MKKSAITRRPSAALACGVLLAAGALGGASAAAAGSHTVSLKEFAFHPRTLSIRRGESVTFVWHDNVEHNVTFHSSHSRTQVHGSYTVRFTRTGTFNYRCTIHASEGMTGKVIVR